jgi:hypothetical protein
MATRQAVNAGDSPPEQFSQEILGQKGWALDHVANFTGN